MIDIIIIIAFFVLSLLIGLYSSRNIKNFEHFSVGHRSFSSFVIFATLSASFIGGGYTLGNASKVYEIGMISAFALLGFSVKEILVGLFIAPKMEKHRHCLSVGDIIEKDYGLIAKIFTGLLSVLLCSGILGAQVGALAVIFETFFNVHTAWTVIAAFFVVICYSTLGGMRAVVYTDVFQFFILFVGIPITFFLGIQHIGGFHMLFDKTPHNFTHIINQPKDVAVLVTLFLTFVLGETLVPPYLQRLFMGRDESHTKRGTIASGIVSMPFFIIAGSIGLIAYVMNPNLPSNEALPYVVKHVLPTGISGFVIASLLAIIVSSASSYLNSGAISLVNDVLKPLTKGGISQKTWLIIAKLSTIIIGIAAIFFALSINNVLDILLYAYNFWSPMLLVPLVITLLGKKAYKKDFFASIIGGLLGAALWPIGLYEGWGISSVVVGILASGLFCFLGRILLPE